eukprot:PITA_28961
MERARSMINNAKLQKELWAEAVSTTCYLVNRSPLVAINYKIPEEVWTGQSCDYSHLRVFRCDVYSLIPKNQHSKLDPKLKCYVFVGYDDAVKGYRLWDPILWKIVISRDVTFDESSFLKSNVERIEQEQEAVDDTNSEKWKMAMKERIDSLAKNNTWDLVELPKGRSVVGFKWVFKLKQKVDGSIKRYKARLVAKGYSQVEGIDFHKVFYPVVKLVSIRNVLALTAFLNLELE